LITEASAWAAGCGIAINRAPAAISRTRSAGVKPGATNGTVGISAGTRSAALKSTSRGPGRACTISAAQLRVTARKARSKRESSPGS